MTSLGGERRIKLTLQYDGAGFFGWQVQPGVRTVQAELEAAMSRLTDRTITVIAAGRTDRGVHATGQVASALVPEKWTAAALLRALNSILPHDIRIESAVEVPPAFHARYDAVSRSYFYRVGTAPEAWSPFQRRWCWPLRAE
ncbi:MAG: tRNA pseudouridine synthase A, partial [Gemmatimonadota bacterium]